MKTITRDELTTLKPQFITWLENHWCDCIERRRDDDDDDWYWDNPEATRHDGHPCMCYGRDEFDSIYRVEIDDDGAIRMPMVDHNDSTLIDPTHRSVIYVPDDDEIYTHYPHITYGGDDYDYYQPIVRWLIATYVN